MLGLERLITESLPSRSSESNRERQVGKYKGAANVAVTEVCRMSISGYRGGGWKTKATLKSFHHGHDISDCVPKILLAPASVTRSKIGSGPALLMK